MNAIITGATKGIGRAVAELFAQNGFNVAICSRTQTDVDALKKHLEDTYSIEVIGQVVDMSKKDAVKNFAAAIVKQWASIDILVNNAGVFIPCELAQSENESAFEMMMDLNLYSTYYMTQSILPSMITQKKGHIFNMCSIASIMPYGAYAVSKHAMLGFSKVLREEVKDKGIRVTAVMPGATYTASWEGTDLPEERFMKAEDIAQTLLDIYNLSDRTVVEEILLRPQLGDI
ncbi:SDR family oxidoreductase [Aureispira sp. CCB-E]|uniref:SDR family oxidoreductase n=1 Tax=Aureispira sp. CCB-E TaxID=3051121 RepID=UPI0028689082|nr:SDR family oxidoreductase [Aureispira sp. CCB-E]WMX14708.1 SDR family oxidoreductase [Aureispira sp. CCB-E]